MTSSNPILAAALIALLALAMPAAAEQTAAPAQPAAAKAAQQSYATPDEAVAALVAATRAADLKALLAVVGPSAEDWISSGDPVADRADWRQFVALYDAKHAIVANGDARATLTAGDDPWPFPAPLVRKDGRWQFDAAAGKEEVLKRRIGRNELDTIQTLLAIVDAQREYAVHDGDHNGVHDYARRIMSSPGKRDGLYWAAPEGAPASPLGRLVAAAEAKGYVATGDAPSPYQGYLFRILTAQGKDAPGGAYDYLLRDHLMGGFAVIAWPAKYANSGIMTFIVNHTGVVYEKDLGDATADQAAKITRFNPGKGWKRAQY
ncbi:MAG TPA: DUF2950 domain-containing protein [Steroidobacteraceae bacterium]|nr:DUF2950 domain-containing protein [Steroidobacteraceae bacterium]